MYGANIPPRIVSVLPPQAVENVAYSGQVNVEDPDGDTLTFGLTDEPAGMSIDSNGAITWTPPDDNDVTFTITVNDGRGGEDSYTFTLQVLPAGSVLEPPEFTSEPLTCAVKNQLYEYTLVAEDPYVPALEYRFEATPDTNNMSLGYGTKTAPFTWTPDADQVGTYRLTFTASNGTYITSQSVLVEVRDSNSTPSISMPATTSLTEGQDLVFDVSQYVSDSDDTELTYELLDGTSTVPDDMSIDSFGRIIWSSVPLSGNNTNVKVKVTDPCGESAEDTITISVNADTEAPVLTISTSVEPAYVNQDVKIFISAQDNVRVTSLTLTADGVNIALDANKTATITPSTAGLIELVATANDAAGNGPIEATKGLWVIDPSDQNPPTVSITAPYDGQEIDAPIDIIGTASDENLAKYELSVRPVNGDDWTLIGSGTSSIIDGKLGTLDPSVLANGGYSLRLYAEDANGSYMNDYQSFNVNSKLKLGNFNLSFVDLSLPVSGIPITIERSYDTLDAARIGDFGYGWKMSYRDGQVKVNEQVVWDTLLGDWYPDYPAFTDYTRVWITLPGGQKEMFEFTPREEFSWPYWYYYPAFTAGPGVTSTLSVSQYANQYMLSKDATGGYIGASNWINYNPADSTFGGKYYLTTKEGLTYTIDARTGKILTIQDRNGNQLSFTETSITGQNAEGKQTAQVTIERDQLNRVVSITDPAGKSIVYTYDTDGDLVEVTPRAGEDSAVTLKYEASQAHYLTQIVDGRGVAVMTVNFGTDGRIESITDANGNSAPFNYTVDLGDNQHLETVTDALGNLTELVRDDRGNVTRKIQRVEVGSDNYIITVYEYNSDDKLTKESEPFLIDESGLPAGEDRYSYSPEDDADWYWRTQTTYEEDLWHGGTVETTTDGEGNITVSEYDQYGNLLSQSDPMGNTTTNSYDSSGNLSYTQVKDAAGNVVSRTDYTYENGQLKTITDADGNTVSTFTYDGSGNASTITDAAGFTQTFGYNTNGNQTSSSYTANGKTVVTETSYDDEGRVDGTTQKVGGVTQWTTSTVYNEAGQVTESTDRFGTVTYNTYDGTGNLIETKKQTPDENGNLKWVITRTAYDANGRAIIATDPYVEGTATADIMGTKTNYDALGRVESTERWRGVEVFYEGTAPLLTSGYDLDEAYRISITSNVYDAAGRVTQTTGTDGQTTYYEYDNAGRQTAVITPMNESESKHHRIEYVYDAAGRQKEVWTNISQTSPTATPDYTNVRKTLYYYDALGRVTKTIFPDGNEITTIYNSLGQKESETDQLGNTTNFEYEDGTGRLTAVVLPAVADPDNGDTMTQPEYQYYYDNYGNQTCILDPKGRATVFEYDHLNRQTKKYMPYATTLDPSSDPRPTYAAIEAQMPDPAPASETKEYDDYGNLEVVKDFKGQYTKYIYDYTENPGAGDSGRLVEKRFYANEAAYNADSPTEIVSYTYDALGRQVKVIQDRDGNLATTTDQDITEYTYDDAFGWLKQVLTKKDAAEIGQVNYTYEAATGRVTKVATETSSEIDYTYDNQGRLKTVTTSKRNGISLSPNEEITEYTYTLVGSRNSVEYPNFVKTTYTYNDTNQLTNVLIQDISGAPVTLAQYAYTTLGANGRREVVTETDNAGDETTITYGYDALNRLTSESYSPPAADNYTYSYTYDLVGNRTKKEIDSDGDDNIDETITYTCNSNDQLTRENSTVSGITDYAYDANGSLETKTSGGVTLTYTYNIAQRLTQLSSSLDRNTTYHYTYNDQGIRTSYIRKWEGNVKATTYYLVDPANPTGYAQVFEEITYAETGTTKITYTIGDDIITQSTYDGVNTTTRHLLYDGHGSTRLLTDENGDVKNTYDYEAYGYMANAGSAATKYLYAGQQYDPNLEMYYLRARYYDPTIGRFNRIDPFAGDPYAPQSLHKYAYVHNNPVNNIDPTGMFTYTGLAISMAIGATIGAIVGGVYAHYTKQSVWKGILVGAGIGAVLGAAFYLLFTGVGSGALKRFFSDPRSWKTISRQYWKQFGPANGSSLHHWLIPQKYTWISQGIRNAGFNLLRMPKILPGSLGLNQWIGFAVRWGGTRMVVACLVQNGIRILIPVTAYATYHASKWAGNELAEEAIELAEGGTATPIQLNQEEVREMQNDAGEALLDELE